ncbi:MAG: NUDIX domain-containing protein [Acidobacteria bacterium]|nr:MAG: NUDIX domain-containing protein [Acidobacteriota bacterium]
MTQRAPRRARRVYHAPVDPAAARQSPARSPRPRDAATLVLLRDDRRAGPVVLMGRRRTRDAWSDLYVFPGGRVDRDDHRVRAASELRPEVAARLEAGATPARGRAIAIAAIRETFEETGLRIAGRSAGPRPERRSPWRQFAAPDGGGAEGWAPALDRLHLLCRAVTPPRRAKRFDARFFVTRLDEEHPAPSGNGELGDLRWIPLSATTKLPLPKITQVVLSLLGERVASGDVSTPPRVPLFKTVHGRHRLLHH